MSFSKALDKASWASIAFAFAVPAINNYPNLYIGIPCIIAMQLCLAKMFMVKE